MKLIEDRVHEQADYMEDVISVCGAIPQGDELPQVGSIEDVVLDVCSSLTTMPRDYVCACYHHQCEDSSFH